MLQQLNQRRKSEKFRYTQMKVMSFGWWNCVNGRIDRENKSDQAVKEFKKMFSKTKTIECDEP